MNLARSPQKLPPVARKAQQAMEAAVARVIEEHRQTGQPLAISKRGRVVLAPADKLVVKETPAVYRVSRKPKK